MGRSNGYDKNAPWCVRDPRVFVVPPRLRTPPSVAKTHPHHEASNGDRDNGHDRRVGSVDARRSRDGMATFPRELGSKPFSSTTLTDRVPPAPLLCRARPRVRGSAPPSPRARRPRRASSNSCLRLLFCLLSPLGTGTRLVRVGGELVAIPHYIKPTGWKAPNAYGSKVVFDGATTKSTFDAKVRKVGEGEVEKKKLMPYHPLASRNRPKSQVENVVGSRFAVPKGAVERYRNSSQVDLSDGHPDSRKPWRTTNQMYRQPKHAGKTGMDNNGIFAEAAQLTHRKQRY